MRPSTPFALSVIMLRARWVSHWQRVAADLGAKVVLVTGPSHLKMRHVSVEVQRVVTAEEMHKAVHADYADTDIVICAAAVADYRPTIIADQKIKKKDAEFSINLGEDQRHPIILGKEKKPAILGRFCLGDRE